MYNFDYFYFLLCVIKYVFLLFGSEETRSKIGKGKICGFASNRTMVSWIGAY